MIDSDGFISNDTQQTSTSVRENIQNKNLLTLKGDLYSNTASGVIHLGEEGKLLGGANTYEYALSVDSTEFSSSGIDFRARRSLSYSTMETGYNSKRIDYDEQLSFYPFNFLIL